MALVLALPEAHGPCFWSQIETQYERLKPFDTVHLITHETSRSTSIRL
jgi:hypothetical protein